MIVATQFDIKGMETLRLANRGLPLATGDSASGARLLRANCIAAAAIFRLCASPRRDTATSLNRRPFS